jgi:hypothetical protein
MLDFFLPFGDGEMMVLLALAALAAVPVTLEVVEMVEMVDEEVLESEGVEVTTLVEKGKSSETVELDLLLKSLLDVRWTEMVKGESAQPYSVMTVRVE